MNDIIAGVDEAGRGPLAGPVISAAVVLDPAQEITGLVDSKVLTATKRAKLAVEIKRKALAWAVGRCDVDEIDELNILWASMLSMKRAVEALEIVVGHVLVDGNRCPDLSVPCTAIVKGDSKVAEISAASIIAKETRDAEMIELDQRYPEYGFKQHKGYPTKYHRERLLKVGPCRHHRKSFTPVRDLFTGL